ncbi:MAG: GatB/YqeY domain-containing protein [Chitinophagales bacterium]
MSLEKKVMDAMKAAMRSKDKGSLRALRAVKSAILLAKTAEGGGDALTETQEIKILSKLVKQRKDSLSIYQEQGREDLAAKELEEIPAIEQFLPKQMSKEALETALKAIMEQVGASSMRDMGKVMGIASKQFAGKADGKTISTIVRQMLG